MEDAFVLTTSEVKMWDQHTMASRKISSHTLMEQAAQACVDFISKSRFSTGPFRIFSGTGNNGGDGLAIAALLHADMRKIHCYIVGDPELGSADFKQNFERLKRLQVSHSIVTNEQDLHGHDGIIIDALLGSGLNRPVNGMMASAIQWINKSGSAVISIDIPSGLFADETSADELTVEATFTLSFQSYKPAFLMAENSARLGELVLLNIGLDPQFPYSLSRDQHMITLSSVADLYKPRNRFAHKGTFGHVLLIAGGDGKMGAGVMCAKACLRGGSGLLTCYASADGARILQVAVPEAMIALSSDIDHDFSGETLAKYKAIGLGPGIGTSEEQKQILNKVLASDHQPLVIDADAITLIASDASLLASIPAGSILTPHPREFDRLTAPHPNDFARSKTAIEFAKEHKVVLVLKGHHTQISLPDGNVFFNTTGNAGMAKGGSGDVLTGILTALLGQGYPSNEAAILGVFLHGLSGDLALQQESMESMLPTDLINSLGEAWKTVASAADAASRS
jgi:ADP-dependent NAD(P)H-hydrate dehydratase / NAD(P)H-hydrate epimerase